MELRALLKATLEAQGLTGWMLKLVLWGFGSPLGLKQNTLNFNFFVSLRLYKILFFAPSPGVGSHVHHSLPHAWISYFPVMHCDF